MNEDVSPIRKLQWHKYRFVGMMASVIIISLALTGVSLAIYNMSGAAQVDLSRPGYQSVRKEASMEQPVDQFASNGDLNADAFKQFDAMYKRHATRSADTTSFGEQALSDESLQLFVDGVNSTETPGDSGAAY